uniref:Uncharacterized protein n=1 Tax=Arundo donax TaxID=35708 RepID=A0A0A9HPR4_ARUDO
MSSCFQLFVNIFWSCEFLVSLASATETETHTNVSSF